MFSQDGVLHGSTAERVALTGMADGDQFYDTTLKGLCRYRASAWRWADAALSGVIASRPATTDVPLDTIYACTDASNLYILRARSDSGFYWHSEALGPVEVATAGAAIVINTLLKLSTGKYVAAGAGEAATAQAVTAASADTDPVSIRRFGAWEVSCAATLVPGTIIMSNGSALAAAQTSSNTKLGVVTSGGTNTPATKAIVQVF